MKAQYFKCLEQNRFFKKNFSPRFRDELSKKFDKKVYTPREYIFKQGKLTGETLYFLSRGKVQISTKNYAIVELDDGYDLPGDQIVLSFGFD